MAYESPAAILFDVNGIPMAVTGGITVPVSTSALLAAGMTNTGTATFIRTEPDGTQWITGTLSTTLLGTQTVTGTVALQGLTNVSGALPVFVSASNLLTVTGSITVGNQPTVNQGNSGSFSQAWKTVLTDGTQVIGGGSAAPLWVTGTLTVPGTVTVTGTVGTNQGNAGTIAQSWYTRITDGTQVLGTGSSAPLVIRQAIITGSLVTAIARVNTATALVPSASQTRRGVTVYNDSNANLYVLYGSGTVNQTNNFSIRIAGQGYLEVPANYTGPLFGVWQNAGAGNALVTEFYP